MNLSVSAGRRHFIAGDGTPPHEVIVIRVTNRGERPVTVSTVGWRVGRGKKARHCIQMVGAGSPDDYPKELAHGKSATFSFDNAQAWANEFTANFLHPVTAKNLRTFKAQVHTSVGQTVTSPAEASLQTFLLEHYAEGQR